jgi:hypothetical protein
MTSLRRTSLTLVALVSALAVGSLSATKKSSRAPAASIRSIEPVCAAPGATGRIRGIGFGPGGLRVTVGGVQAQLVAATGTDVTFLVPSGAPQGPVEVQAINPGGHVGRVPWVVARPGGCVLLGGDTTSSALEAIHDLYSGRTVRPEEISTDANGARTARTVLEIWFAEETTVEELNALLDSFGARIVSMLEHVPAVVVRIPDPGSLVALDAVIALLRAEARIEEVVRGDFPSPSILPPNVDPASIGQVSDLRHQLAVRAAAAWNAAGTVVTQPTVLMGDYFALGPPSTPDYFDVEISGEDDLDVVLPSEAGDHGYLVLSPIAARFGGAEPLAGLARTRVRLRVANLEVLTAVEMENRLIQIAREEEFGRRVVINLSVCGPCHDIDCIQRGAKDWTRKVRSSGIEERALIVVAAGNVGQCGLGETAEVSSFYAAAGLIATEAGQPLSNTLAIENRHNIALGGTWQPSNLASSSNTGGHLSGIGSGIRAMKGPSEPPTVIFDGGTSSATPQVSGLAAYLLSIDPSGSLSPQALMDILVETAEDLRDGGAPVIDAYAATLALDAGVDAPSQAPIRMQILDAADFPLPGNEKFDEADIQRFILEGNTSLGTADYSRFDLNGDGRRSGAVDRVDLNASGTYTTGVKQTIEGISVPFDENSVTDLEVLCYYAYSGLYKGNESERTRLLGDVCTADCPPAAPLGSFQTLDSLAAPAADDVCEEPGGGGGGGGGGSVPPKCDPLVAGEVNCFDRDCWGAAACSDPRVCRGPRNTFTTVIPGGGCGSRINCARFLLDVNGESCGSLETCDDGFDDEGVCTLPSGRGCGWRSNRELLDSCGLSNPPDCSGSFGNVGIPLSVEGCDLR